MPPNVAIACGATKLDRAAQAHQLYTGSFFGQCKRWALSVTDLDHLYIVSAKYGLVAARQVLLPYDMTLRSPGHATVYMVAGQLRALSLHDVVFVGGRPYADLLRAAGAAVETPFDGLGGIGYIKSALNRYHGRIPDAAMA